jgi:hypothetical protein
MLKNVKLLFSILLLAFCSYTVGYSAEMSGLISCVEASDSCEKDQKSEKHSDKSKDCHCVCHVNHSVSSILNEKISTPIVERSSEYNRINFSLPARVPSSVEKPPQINS